MIKQVEILKDLIADIQRVVEVTAIVDNGDDTYTLSTPFTYYLTISKKVTIDGLIYNIKNFELNVSLTLVGVGHTTVPTATSFEIDAPTFRHGTPKMVNAEHTKENIPENKYPWIWMVEINDITNEGDFSPLVRSTMDTNLFFFTENDRANWFIDDHYTNAIYPMLNEIEFFMSIIEDRTDLFGEEVSYITTNHVNFGDYLIDKGNETKIISDFLSGVQLKMSLPYVVEVCPDNLPVIVCKPAKLFTNGVFFTEILAGKQFDLPILDETTLLPVGNPNVGNTAFLVPSPGAGVTGIAYCYPRTRQTEPFEGELLGQGQLFLNGVYSTSLLGVSPILDNDHPYYKLDIATPGSLPNKDGNEFIWTGRDGGYIDEFDVFHLLNGDVTTRAGAFPDGIAFNNYNGLDYPIDTVTSTTMTQTDAESFVDALTFGGFADWRVCHPGEANAMGLFNNSNAFSNGLFAYANTNHWTNETNPLNSLHGAYFNVADGSSVRRQVKTTKSRFFMCRTHTFT